MSLLIFIIILGLLVFVHELGHFVFAKLFGVRVDEFGMGFPPRAMRLFKRGETEYTLNWIPFGGFVKIHGEDSLGVDDPDFHRSMMAKKWWQQIIVLIAGVTMNVVLAWVLFSSAYMIGAPTPESQVTDLSRLESVHLTILDISPGSPAELAQLQAGDKIQQVTSSIGILTNASAESFTQFVQQTPRQEPVTLSILRNKEPQEIVVYPSYTIVPDKPIIGVAVDRVGDYQQGFFASLSQGAQTTYHTIGNTLHAFGQLFSGKSSLQSVTGPVGLVSVVGDARDIGFSYLIIFTAIISINLAIINMVPFPALDGGRILFVIIEKIIRRPLPQKFVQWTNGVGFLLLIGLMIFVTIKDVIKLF